MQVFLLGFRGVGKSTIAKELSNNLGFGMIDVDLEITKFSNKTIEELTHGGKNWSHFRLLETEILLKYCNQEYSNTIISCGGGACVNDTKISWIDFNLHSSSELKNLHNTLKSKYDTNSFSTFGRLQKQIIFSHQNVIPILLTAPIVVIKNRLEAMYSNFEASHRQSLSGTPSIDIHHRINEDIQSYKARELLYKSISEYVIDTNDTIPNCINKIKLCLHQSKNKPKIPKLF